MVNTQTTIFSNKKMDCKHFFIWIEEKCEFSSSVQMKCRHCQKSLVEEEANKSYRWLCGVYDNGLAVFETNVANHTPGYVHQHAWQLVETKGDETVYKCARHVRDWGKWAPIGTCVKPCNAIRLEASSRRGLDRQVDFASANRGQGLDRDVDFAKAK